MMTEQIGLQNDTATATSVRRLLRDTTSWVGGNSAETPSCWGRS